MDKQTNPLEDVMEKLMENPMVRAYVLAHIEYTLTVNDNFTVTFKTVPKVRFLHIDGDTFVIEAKYPEDDKVCQRVEVTLAN